MMYEDLVKSLRTCVSDGDCQDCKMFGVRGGDSCGCLYSLLAQAADAIEGLSVKVKIHASFDNVSGARNSLTDFDYD